MNEDQARAVLLVQAFESAPEGPLWTAEDRLWATRAAQQSAGAAADRPAWVAERARLALQRLAPRDAGVQRLLAHRLWHPAAPLLALAAGGVLGLLSDTLVAGPYFNLLSPLFWGLLAWNLGLYAWLAVGALRRSSAGPLRQAAVRLLQRWARRGAKAGPWRDFAARWVPAAAPLTAARAAVLLHALAAGMALGLIAGLVLRGLVFDYRAAWATTLLQPETVRAALALLLAPAHAVTGIAAPDAAAFDALRLMPGQLPQASAAPWIVLMAAQLALVVVLPRALLTAAAAWRARALAAEFPLALAGPYFERLRPGAPPRRLWVLPHAQAPQPQAVLGLRHILARVWGEALPLQIAPALPYGEEDDPPPAPAGARVLVLVDLAATPEPDVHGRLLGALAALAAGAEAPLLLADESGFLARFGPGSRHDERRAGWRALAHAHGAGFVAADLQASDLRAAEDALRDAVAA